MLSKSGYNCKDKAGEGIAEFCPSGWLYVIRCPSYTEMTLLIHHHDLSLSFRSSHTHTFVRWFVWMHPSSGFHPPPKFLVFIQLNPRLVKGWPRTKSTPGREPTSSQCPGAAPGGHVSSLDSPRTQETAYGSPVALQGRWGGKITRVPPPSVSRHHPYLHVFSRSPSSLTRCKPAITADRSRNLGGLLSSMARGIARAHARGGGRRGEVGAGSCRDLTPERLRIWPQRSRSEGPGWPCVPIPFFFFF